MDSVVREKPGSTYALTLYRRKKSTFPAGPFDEYKGLQWHEVIELVAPDVGPRVLRHKDQVPCITSGLLSEGKLTPCAQSVLSERAGEFVTHGRSRCINCCRGPFKLMPFDVDGVKMEALEDLLLMLLDIGVDYLIYSSFNFGDPAKPGCRFRLIFPLDAPVSVEQYQVLHRVLSSSLLAAVMSDMDRSSRFPWQQQGVWATRPDLQAGAFRYLSERGICLSTQYWLSKAPAPVVQTAKCSRPPICPISGKRDGKPTALELQLEMALGCIPARTRHFQSLLVYLKATEHMVPALDLFRNWAWSDPEHQAQQQAMRDAYDPDKAWLKVQPSLPLAAAVGATHKLARECAIETVKHDLDLISERAKHAATYLRVHHKRHYDALKESRAAMHDQVQKQQQETV